MLPKPYDITVEILAFVSRGTVSFSLFNYFIYPIRILIDLYNFCMKIKSTYIVLAALLLCGSVTVKKARLKLVVPNIGDHLPTGRAK